MADEVPDLADQSRRARVARNAEVAVRAARGLFQEAELPDLLGFLDPKNIAAASRLTSLTELDETKVRRAFRHQQSTQAFDHAGFQTALCQGLVALEPFGPIGINKEGAGAPTFAEALVTICRNQFSDDPVTRGLHSTLLVLAAAADTDENAKSALREVNRITWENIRRLRAAYLPDEPRGLRETATDLFVGWLWASAAQAHIPGRIVGVDHSESEQAAIVGTFRELATAMVLESCGAADAPEWPLRQPFAKTSEGSAPHSDVLRAAVVALGQADAIDDILGFIGPRPLARRCQEFDDLPAGRRLTRDQIITAFHKEGTNRFDRRALVEVVNQSFLAENVDDALDESVFDLPAQQALARFRLILSSGLSPNPEEHDPRETQAVALVARGRVPLDPEAAVQLSVAARMVQQGYLVCRRVGFQRGGLALCEWLDDIITRLSEPASGTSFRPLPGGPSEYESPTTLPTAIEAIVREQYGALAVADEKHNGLTIRIPGLEVGLCVLPARLGEYEMVEIGARFGIEGRSPARDDGAFADLQRRVPFGAVRRRDSGFWVTHFAFVSTLTRDTLVLYVDSVATLVRDCILVAGQGLPHE